MNWKLWRNGLIFLLLCFLEAKFFDWILGVANLHFPSAIAMWVVIHILAFLFFIIGVYVQKLDE